MSTLFVVTSISDLLINMITREYLRNLGGVSIVTTNVSFYDSHRKMFDGMFLIDGVSMSNSRDASFAEVALPGELAGETFPNTGLEIWKVLSLDRFKHWYNPEFKFILEFLDTLSWDTLYASSDLGQTVPLMSGFQGESDRKRIWVKTEPIRTREFMDILGSGVFPFDGIITDSEDDIKFIVAHGNGVRAIYATLGQEEGLRIDQSAKAQIKANLGINGNVLCVLFDKRDEWQCRSFIADKSYKKHYNHTFIYPVDQRSRQLVYTSIPNAHELLLAQDTLLKIADSIVSFRWDDNYMKWIEIPIQIIDYNGMNKALFLAPEGVKVQ